MRLNHVLALRSFHPPPTEFRNGSETELLLLPTPPSLERTRSIEERRRGLGAREHVTLCVLLHSVP